MVTKTKKTKVTKQIEGLTLASIIPATQEIERMIDYFKQDMDFQKIRVTPIIQTSGKRAVLGHFTTERVWIDKDGNESHEIQVSAEFLDRPWLAIAATVRHELIHMKNCECGIEDTSNGGTYHNKKWLVAANHYGLVMEEPTKKNGHGLTKGFNPVYEAVVLAELQPNDAAFNLIRKQTAAKSKNKKKSKMIKWSCECGKNVRAAVSLEGVFDIGGCATEFTKQN
jgi:hypothetical protein